MTLWIIFGSLFNGYACHGTKLTNKAIVDNHHPEFIAYNEFVESVKNKVRQELQSYEDTPINP